MRTCLITGCNRGIGLELARQLASRGDRVSVTCRSRSRELDALDVTIIEDIDVTLEADIERLKCELTGVRLDWLILNAGVFTHESLEDLDLDGLRRQFEVNALGPLRVTSALLDNLGAGSRIGIVTSLMGSMADNGSGGYYGYRMSKAALNAAGVSLARDLSGRGIAVALLHPGMVATDMTDCRGVPVPDSARGLIARMDELTLEKSGSFVHAEGQDLPF